MREATSTDPGPVRLDDGHARSIHANVQSRLLAAHLREELRELAWDLVGRPERDELTTADRARLESAVEAAAESALSATLASLRADLVDRVEDLPLSIRVTLANVRRRRDLGFD